MLLRRLLEAVKDVKKAIQEHSDSVCPEKKHPDQEKIIPKSIVTEVHFDKDTIKTTAAENQRQYDTQVKIVKATRAAVAAAIIYAGVATWQVCEMRKATRLQERAWVGLDKFNIGSKLLSDQPVLGPIIPNVPIRGSFVLQNFGKVPANIDGVGIKLEARTSPVPEDFGYGPEAVKKGWTIFPSQPMWTYEAEYTISETSFQAIKHNASLERGEERLVLHGIVKYHDVFGNHTTKICLIWRPEALEGKGFNNCIEHNDTD